MAFTNKAFKKFTGEQMQAVALTEPRCPHASECGGCSFQERDYSGQVQAKTNILRTVWAALVPQVLPAELVEHAEVVPSPDPYNYRTRMDYVATKGRFGLRKPGRFNYIIDLEACHLIPPAAFHVARQVWDHAQELGVPDYHVRTHEGFLRYIVVRRSPQDTLLLAAVTADGDYAAEMSQLAEVALALPAVQGFHWLRNAGMSDLSFGEPVRHWGAETLAMHIGAVTLHIGPNSFFQNNVHLMLSLLDAVRTAVLDGPPPQRVADLYSGVGAITLHLAPHVGRIVGVEAHPESGTLAQKNIVANGATNALAHMADVGAFLRTQRADSFDVIVADPPRTGLGLEVCHGLRGVAPRRIVYVSCNPLTQAEDLRQLAPDYRVTALRGYDMFPHTPHVESLAILDHRAVAG